MIDINFAASLYPNYVNETYVSSQIVKDGIVGL